MKMELPNSRTVMAIVAAYFPEKDTLQGLLDALFPQVNAVTVVDNTSDPDGGVKSIIPAFTKRNKKLKMVSLGENRGIAAAFNIGIEQAIKEGFDYVLLSDQDSLPDTCMVDGLKKCYSTLREKGVNVGAVFPEYYDLTTGQSFNFQAYTPGNFFYKSVPGSQAIPWLEIITAISSGSLIPCNVLKTVGAMREDFFIDDVDTEWCHRARSCGFKLFGTSRARLTHRLGDESFRVWYFGWRAHNKYSGLRLYYRFRNFVLMCCLPHVPLRWSIRAGWYWLGNLYAYCFFAPDRWANAKAIAMGLWDGLRGRSGPYHGKSLDNRGLNILMQDRKPVAKKQ